MTDGTTPDVFGGQGDDLFAADFPSTEAPEATATPETPEPQVTEQPAEAPAPEAPSPEPETPAAPEQEAPAEEQPRIGGKFRSVEDLTVAYENAQRMATQRAQDAARTRSELDQLRQQQVATAQVLKELEPVLRGMQSGEIEVPGLDVENPQQVQALIDRQVEQKLQERLAPIQQQQERVRVEQAMTELTKFRTAHPDSAPHEEAIASVVQEYRYDPDTKAEVFAPTADNLAIAYTLATRPDVKALVDEVVVDAPTRDLVDRAVEALGDRQLAEVVQAMPSFIEKPSGMAFARKLAGLPAVVTTAQTKATEATKQAAEAARKAAHVEVDQEASTVGSAPGNKPADFLAEAVAEEQKLRKESVFF